MQLFILINLFHLLIYYWVTHLSFIVLKIHDGEESPFYAVFIKSIVGFFFVVSTYAIIITKGHSVLTIVPLLLILFLFFVKRQGLTRPINFKKRDYTKKSVFVFVTFIIVVITIMLYWHFHNGHGIVSHLKGDLMVYAKLSSFMNNFSIESNQIDYFYPLSHASTPYHYGEHWLSALAIRFYECDPEKAIVLVCLVQIFALSILGVAALIEKKYNSSLFWIITISIASLFLGPLSQLIPFRIKFISEFWGDVTYLALPKISLVLLFLLFIELQLLQKNLVAFTIGCVLLSLFYTPCLSILPIALIIIGREYYFKRAKITIFSISLTLLAVSILYLYFKYGVGAKSGNILLNDPDLMKFYSHKEVFNSLEYFRTFLNIVGSSLLYIFKATLIYILLVIIIFINVLYHKKRGFFIRVKSAVFKNCNILIFLVIPILTWGTFSFVSPDAFQLWLMLFYPYLIVLIVQMLAKFSTFKKLWFVVPILILTNVLSHSVTLKASFRKVDRLNSSKISEMNLGGEERIAYVCDSSRYNSIFIVAKDEEIQEALQISPYFYRAACLSIFSIDTAVLSLNINDSYRMFFNEAMKQMPFYVYLKICREENPMISIVTAQLKFIDHFNIRLIFVEKGIQLNPKLSETLILKTELENSLVYMVKY